MDKQLLDKIKNIIGYLRKSRKDEEREKRTGEDILAEQKNLMTRVLNDIGIPYDIEPEIGSGDKISTRPVFIKIIEELRNDKYNAIAVKEISRLGRGSYTDMGIIYDLIIERNIYIITPWKIYDPSNPNDLRQIRFEMFLSREEFESIRERLTGARYNYAMQGKWMTGSVPYGYQYNDHTQKLEIIDAQANVIKLIFDLYLNGIDGEIAGFRKISTYLKNLGIKSPKGKERWDTTQLKRVVENSVYIGQVKFRTTKRFNGKVTDRPLEEHIIVDNAHDNIIKEIDWYDALKKIKTNKTIPRVKFGEKNYALSGLIVCKSCGSKMVVQNNDRKYTQKSGDISIYHDFFLRCKNGCQMVKYPLVEEKVLNFLKYLKTLDNSKLNNYLKEKYVKEQSGDKSNIQQEVVQSFDKQHKELKNRLVFIQQKHFEGIYSDDQYIDFSKKIAKEIADLEKIKLQNNKPNEKRLDININDFKTSVSDMITLYEGLEKLEDKNMLLREIFDSIILGISEKAIRGKNAKIELTPIIKLDFIDKNMLM